MPSVERLTDEGSRRGRRALLNLADEYRDKRVAAGLSQAEVAVAAGVSRRSYQRIEAGTMGNLTIASAARVASVLGLDVAVRAYPGANAMRAAAHGARLARVMGCVAPPLTYGTEVPLPQSSDRPFEQRAWDAMVTGAGKRTSFEMEMRLRDAQALERRLALKRRDDPVDGLVLLVADTRGNRRALRENPTLFPNMTRLAYGELARLLRAGQHPPDAVVLV